MATGRLPDPNSAPVTAKGDLYTYSTVPAKLAVGNNGETLVADSSTSTGLRWQGNYAAGKNKIINGDFGIWQRGSSFTMSSGSAIYTADRMRVQCNFSAGSATTTRETFTPGTAPVAGYEGQYFLRVTNASTTTVCELAQLVEDVRTFAGQTVTLSFWAKASSTVTMGNVIYQTFGSGGSANVTVNSTQGNQTFTNTWTRYVLTFSIPSISGKTIGTNSHLQIFPFYYVSGTINSNVIDIWGLQLEAGNTATAFQTATGTLAGELAACQRYYQKSYSTDTAVPTNATGPGLNYAISGNAANSVYIAQVPFRVSMRSAPTVTIYSYTTSQTGRVSDGLGTDLAATSGVANVIGTNSFALTNSSGGTINAAAGGFTFHWAASSEL